MLAAICHAFGRHRPYRAIVRWLCHSSVSKADGLAVGEGGAGEDDHVVLDVQLPVDGGLAVVPAEDLHIHPADLGAGAQGGGLGLHHIDEGADGILPDGGVGNDPVVLGGL